MAQIKDILTKLTSEGMVLEVDTNAVHDSDSDPDEDTSATLKQVYEIADEETYNETELFENLAKRMFDLLPDGKIKKRIIREGKGGQPPDHATVTIHYNAYVELNGDPFDSTYMRNKPFKFVLNDGRVIPGLDFAVQTMKLHEKAHFLIDSDYAYRSSNIGRIPPNSTCLFEVELLDIVDSGFTLTYENLSEDQQKTFSETFKYCLALCEKGKKEFKERNYKKAIIDYNTAVGKLNQTLPNNNDDIKCYNEIMLRLYSNLIICYLAMSEPKKGCLNAEKIYKITQNGEIFKIPIKVYFNHAKCLRLLGDYDKAKEILNKALKIEPDNTEIGKEICNLENVRLKYQKTEKDLAKAFINTLNIK